MNDHTRRVLKELTGRYAVRTTVSVAVEKMSEALKGPSSEASLEARLNLALELHRRFVGAGCAGMPDFLRIAHLLLSRFVIEYIPSEGEVRA